MSDKPKLLLHSNAPWVPTGYGQQCGLFAPLLAEHYDLAISAFFGLEGAPIKWQGITVLPGIGGEYGQTTIAPHAAAWFGGDPKAGLVLTLMDVWVLDPSTVQDVNMACWVPVDHDPAPPRVADFFMQSGAVPIAMSRFGEKMLGRLDPLYVPHGVDTGGYRHVEDKVIRGDEVPADAFVVGMVAANKGRPSRKAFPQALEAFAKFSKQHDDCYLYLHTTMNPEIGLGEDIGALLIALDIPLDRVKIPDQYRLWHAPFTVEEMAKVYSSMDVLLNPSLGEGFGVPVLEAASCGIPSIVTDATAMPEVCGAGWAVEHHPYWTGQKSWQAIPKIDDIVTALNECYEMSSARREKMSRLARSHALRYDVRKVFKQQMLPALRTVEQRFSDREPVTIPSRLKVAA